MTQWKWRAANLVSRLSIQVWSRASETLSSFLLDTGENWRVLGRRVSPQTSAAMDSENRPPTIPNLAGRRREDRRAKEQA